MIAGTEKPDSGTVKIGPTVKMAYVEQSRESLEGDKTVCRTSPADWTT